MISGIYSFEKIIEDVKTETGFTNLRNRYPEIIQLIARAEREINPFTNLLVRKKMLYYVGNGNFDGSSIKKPKDYVFTDKVGCCEDGLCDGSYFETVSHIVICDKVVRTEIRFSYWALQHDGRGYPITSYNHADAVVAYIVWKLYSPKVFVGEGSMQNQLLYERQFEERCGEARGEDMFPDEGTLNNIHNVNRWTSFDLHKKTTYDRCLSCDQCLTQIEDTLQNLSGMRVYYWQLNSPFQTINNLIPLVNPTYLYDKQYELFSTFEVGHTVVNPYVGKLSLAIYKTALEEYKIYDIFDSDVTDEFQSYFFADTGIMLFTSKNNYDPSNLFLRLKKITNNYPVVQPDFYTTFDETFDNTFI